MMVLSRSGERRIHLAPRHSACLIVTQECIVLMQIVNKRRPTEIAYGLFLLSHPAPVLLHTIGVTIFTLLAAWTSPQPTPATILLVISAHTAMQISIAMLNDYCDRHAHVDVKP